MYRGGVCAGDAALPLGIIPNAIQCYTILMATDRDMAQAAKRFAAEWKDKGYEKGESQRFWIELLGEVFGVDNPAQYITFEDQVKLDTSTGFIDGYIAATKVMIEQKSINKNLRDGILQSDGSLLTPFQQARRYITNLPLSRHPRWVVTSNFKSFLIYDMEKPHGDPAEVLLEDLPREYYRLQFLVNQKSEHIAREEELSFKAGKIVGEIYDAFAKEYADLSRPESQRALNELCVRLVFCLYAEDAGLFGARSKFHDYLANFTDPNHMRKALIELFRMLDTPEERRDRYDTSELNTFPYVNGGLFSNEQLEIPSFTPEISALILEKASDSFDWSEISPTIFGAVFESTLNPETRRKGGMHYTSIENIHKVIDPLFLDSLKAEFADIKTIKTTGNINTKSHQEKITKLNAFQDKLANLTFFDPACGSGNFLTETFLSLRRLENQVIQERTQEGQMSLDTGDLIKVSIQQFYGIEINDFAVTVAKTALWIAESQMLAQTAEIIHTNLDFLPLKSYTNITEGNALRIEWRDVVPENLSYIIGNPPFIGQTLQTREQKLDMIELLVDESGKSLNFAGKVDYVAGWFWKSSVLIQNSKTQCALVSTNSICQGEQVSSVLKTLFEKFNIHIDFAYKTFKWNNEADSRDQAAVHVVIVGFSRFDSGRQKKIFEGDNFQVVSQISPYLTEGHPVFIENRNDPISKVPRMIFGNMPRDGGHFIMSAEEREEVLLKEPEIAQFIKPYIGAAEFINNKVRYCLWLTEISPNELRKSQFIMNRIAKVRDFRQASKASSTRDFAKTPTVFAQLAQPDTDYLLVPSVSSENRRYIPIGFMPKDVISSNANLLVPNATLYEFGVLTSNVHMAWMRTVAGRLEMRYRYSAKIVYNNFPWPTVTPEQRAEIERTAQGILDARAQFAGSSLADLYDELTMPSALRKAHQANDRAVMKAYGMNISTTTESSCVEALFAMYEELTKGA